MSIEEGAGTVHFDDGRISEKGLARRFPIATEVVRTGIRRRQFAFLQSFRKPLQPWLAARLIQPCACPQSACILGSRICAPGDNVLLATRQTPRAMHAAMRQRLPRARQHANRRRGVRDCAITRLAGGELHTRTEKIETVVQLTASQTVNSPNVSKPYRDCAFAGSWRTAIA